MKNENVLIGLFQGMFAGNFLTFNPGWNQAAEPLDSFDDVRDIQSHLKKHQVPLDQETDPAGEGLAVSLFAIPREMFFIDHHLLKKT